MRKFDILTMQHKKCNFLIIIIFCLAIIHKSEFCVSFNSYTLIWRHMFPLKFHKYLPDCTASHPRRH